MLINKNGISKRLNLFQRARNKSRVCIATFLLYEKYPDKNINVGTCIAEITVINISCMHKTYNSTCPITTRIIAIPLMKSIYFTRSFAIIFNSILLIEIQMSEISKEKVCHKPNHNQLGLTLESLYR